MNKLIIKTLGICMTPSTFVYETPKVNDLQIKLILSIEIRQGILKKMYASSIYGKWTIYGFCDGHATSPT
jgi:prepilin-type processing-associated H-X9-DG protein